MMKMTQANPTASPRDIDETVQLVPGDVAQGDDKIVAEQMRLLFVAQSVDGIDARYAPGVREDGGPGDQQRGHAGNQEIERAERDTVGIAFSSQLCR